MIKNKGFKLSFSISFSFALLFHLVVLFFVKKNPTDFSYPITPKQFNRPLKIDHIELMKREEVEKIKRVGIKDGIKKDYLQPDMLKIPKAAPPAPTLSLGNLAPRLPVPQMPPLTNNQQQQPHAKNIRRDQSDSLPVPSLSQEGTGNIYYNPKKDKSIRRDREQDNLKQEAFNTITTSSSNPVAQKISNFEIRYERPEGVSEDELNSDEKAYYSFFKRSYASYLSKLYATYDRIAVERPGIEKDFANKHVLLGRIDYDEKGNIVLVKILKSSESDNIHYFFEETLKQLNLPNPPKSFIKSKKQFSTYYQIQIN